MCNDRLLLLQVFKFCQDTSSVGLCSSTEYMYDPPLLSIDAVIDTERLKPGQWISHKQEFESVKVSIDFS